jgi:transcription elongation factor Elf1
MKLFGFEITKLESKPESKTVNCHHCGKEFQTGVNNIRAYNYCSSC